MRMARRWSVAPLLVAGMALTAAPAAADTLSALRSDKVVEKAHAITVALGRGHAKLTVRRTLHNGGDRHDQATIAIEVPTDAVATGLRTQGMVNGVPQWFAAELLEAERAAAKYKELTGIGGAYPKDPALLSWRQPGLYWLQVFPVGPNDDKTVEYTLRLPTSYAQGRDVLHLPALGTADRKAEIHVEPALGSDRVRVTPDEDGGFDAELTRGSAKPIEGALAVVPFGPGRVLMRQRFEAAAKLGEVPRGARVVVVMDASRSVDTARAHAQVLAARAYLQHFPDAEVETLLFDRKVTALHGRLVPVKDAIASLEKLTITGRNG